MLITKLKDTETIKALISGKVFILNCHGCAEVSFPMAEANALQQELVDAGCVTGVFTTDYICNPENLELRLSKHAAEIEAATTKAMYGTGKVELAQISVEEVLALCLRNNPEATYAQLKELFHSEQVTVDWLLK